MTDTENSMEKRIEQAIVDKFFEPTWTITTQQVPDANTGYRVELVPHQVPAEMTRVAQAIYEQARAEIVAKVLEKIDIDGMLDAWAPKIAQDVVDRLQTPPSKWSTNPSLTERQKMLDKVYARVAEEFGRQCVEHLKATGGLLAVLEAGRD